MIDSMAHLTDPRVQDVCGLLQRAAAAGVTDVVCAGVDPRTDAELPRGMAPTVRLWRAAGLHPMAVTEAGWQLALEGLEALAATGTLVALGEMGLDGRDGMPAAALQEQALRAQLQLARRLGLPVILHNVWSTAALLALVKSEGGLGPAGGVLHAFGGPAELVPQWVELGAFFSMGGQVARSVAKKVRTAAPAVPLDRLLVESDTPDHAPGLPGPSEPAHVTRVLRALAELRPESAEELAQSTARNAQRLYKLPPQRRN